MFVSFKETATDPCSSLGYDPSSVSSDDVRWQFAESAKLEPPNLNAVGFR